MEPNKFWMVLRDNQGSGAHIRHRTYNEALKEAHRLCQKEKSTFFILEATTAIRPKPQLIPTEIIKLESLSRFDGQ